MVALKPIKDPRYRVISNSEVSTFTTCERRWLYAHYQNIMPKTYSTSLSRGILGHSALAAFYQAIKDGESWHEALMASTRVLSLEFLQPNSDKEMISHLRILLDRYYAFIEQNFAKDFEILEVEKSYILPLTDTYAYGMRLDVLGRYRQGRHFGDIAVIDHKFTYDFWKIDDLRMNAQIPKYAGVLRALGINAVFGVLNQLRHRHKLLDKRSDDELFRRDELEPSPMRVRNIFTEQIKASERIMSIYSLEPEEAEKTVVRNINKMNCKSCPFLDICSVELDGTNTSNIRETWYTANTYGYSPEIEAV